MSGIAVVSRRKFLRALLFMGAAGSAARSSLRIGAGEAHRGDLLALKLGKFFQDREGARAVGLEYLRSAPAEADPRKLTRLICAHWAEPEEDLALPDMRRIKELLRRQQQRDFETDRIVCVQGWILSETEARLCALAALV